MKLKLLPPYSSIYWILVAEELQDPADWSVFLLNHGPGTDRFTFEESVKQASAECNVVLNPYRLMCKRGVCTLEYFWDTQTVTIKAHSARVAELLSIEIEMSQASAPRRTG